MKYALKLIVAMALLTASPALAHPKVVSSSPAAGATVAAPAVINLTFSERFFEKMSGATLAKTGMAGMPGHGAGPIKVAATWSEDGKAMTVTPAAALTPGSYRVDWFGVGADTHRVTGSVSFTIR